MVVLFQREMDAAIPQITGALKKRRGLPDANAGRSYVNGLRYADAVSPTEELELLQPLHLRRQQAAVLLSPVNVASEIPADRHTSPIAVPSSA